MKSQKLKKHLRRPPEELKLKKEDIRVAFKRKQISVKDLLLNIRTKFKINEDDKA